MLAAVGCCMGWHAGTAMARYRFVFEFGTPTKGNSVKAKGSLNVPVGLAEHDGKIVVGDHWGVHIFKMDGSFVRAFTPHSPLQLVRFDGVSQDFAAGYPTDLTVDARGFIYVIDAANDILEETDFHGRLIHSRQVATNCMDGGCSFNSNLASVVGVAVSPDDRLVYTTESDPCCGDAANGVEGVDVFTRTMLPVRTQQLTPPRFPVFAGLSTDRKGHVYVIKGHHVEERTRNVKSKIRSFGFKGNPPFGLRQPIETTEDPQRDVFISDAAGRIVIFHSDGSPLDSFVPRDGMGHKVIPAGMFIDHAHNLWVADENGHVIEYRPSIPQTTITAHPPHQFGGSPVTFTFKSDVAFSTFRCRLLTGEKKKPGFTSCTSPMSYTNPPSGALTFQVDATGPDNVPDPTPARYRLTYSPKPPAVTEPTVSILAGQTVASNGTVSIGLKWSATDSHPKSSSLYTSPGKMRYTLFERSGQPLSDFSPVPGVTDAKGITSATLPLTTGARAEFKVQAENKLDAVGVGPSTGVFASRQFDSASTQVQYSANWSTFPDAQSVGGSFAASNTAGATATIKVKAAAVGVVFLTRPGWGTARVCVKSGTTHETCTGVGLGGATGERRLLYANSGLNPSDSTTVTVTDQSGAVGLDAFETLG